MAAAELRDRDKDLTYKLLHGSLEGMTEDQLAAAIEAELGGEKRTDLLARLVGRFNRVRGKRVKHQVFGALGNKKAQDINALLDRHR